MSPKRIFSNFSFNFSPTRFSKFEMNESLSSSAFRSTDLVCCLLFCSKKRPLFLKKLSWRLSQSSPQPKNVMLLLCYRRTNSFICQPAPLQAVISCFQGSNFSAISTSKKDGPFGPSFLFAAQLEDRIEEKYSSVSQSNRYSKTCV
jgi:hypothetical protein